MKKFLTYITILSAGLVIAVSCSKNGPKAFDDSYAFVGFDSPTASIAEAVAALPSEVTDENGGFLTQTKTLKVPVTLASVNGLSETVKFTVNDKYLDPTLEGDALERASNKVTAFEGVNFNLLTTSGTLSFDAQNRTQYIEFSIIYVTDYTGDLKFSITLSKPESMDLGYNKTCVVTISDVNHPLTDLLGDYIANSDTYSYKGAYNLNLFKDESDDHMVWFFNLFGNSGWADYDTVYYGNVNDDMTIINIPFGQTSEYLYGGSTPVTLYWVNNSDEVGKTGSVDVTIVKDDAGKVTGLDFGPDYGFYALLEGLGYVGLVYPRITAEKQ